MSRAEQGWVSVVGWLVGWFLFDSLLFVVFSLNNLAELSGCFSGALGCVCFFVLSAVAFFGWFTACVVLRVAGPMAQMSRLNPTAFLLGLFFFGQ